MTPYDAIRTYLASAWTTTAIAWPNESYRPGDDPWLAFEISGRVFGQQSIGASAQADNRWDEEGTIWLHLMVKAGSGEKLARQMAKDLAVLFRGHPLMSGALEFLDASIGMGEQGDDSGKWWRISTTVEWRHMEA